LKYGAQGRQLDVVFPAEVVVTTIQQTHSGLVVVALYTVLRICPSGICVPRSLADSFLPAAGNAPRYCATNGMKVVVSMLPVNTKVKLVVAGQVVVFEQLTQEVFFGGQAAQPVVDVVAGDGPDVRFKAIEHCKLLLVEPDLCEYFLYYVF
jgi:hypothetical protein